MRIISAKKMLAVLAAAAVSTAAAVPLTVSADYGNGGNGTAIMEYLDRGLTAVNTGSGMLVSWRFNADDGEDTVFTLYRGDEAIYVSEAGKATCWLDQGGTANSVYKLVSESKAKGQVTDLCKLTSGTNYFEIPLDVPANGVLEGEPYSYSPNDTVCGDVDGDGQYELIVKWDPSNSKDNSQVKNPDKGINSGMTGNVFIDCYTLQGQKLWRIDLGRNIRAGQHYTQLAVADFDSDGKAELITKTADGTKDGIGRVIGNGGANYVNSVGTVLDGPEYLTLFDGMTGEALDTVEFPVPRDASNKQWGDTYGNRCERYNCAIAYLDGVHPSAVFNRGYYTRMTLSAFDVQNKKLVKRWVFDTGYDSSHPAYGCGNHNVMVADLDNDGRQEICMGACAIDDNGKLLWSTGRGHGDAMHIGDLDPNREGIEVFLCHESGSYGISLVDGKTGNIIWHFDGDKDTGRCCADNCIPNNGGAEFWGSRPAYNVYDVKGQQIGNKQPATNFLIYWDGDLERELLNDITISKMPAANTFQDIFTAAGCASNNGTKAVPCLTADLFGDWREELVLRTQDNRALRVYCTPHTTDVRLTTLMHDMQYRMQVGCEQSSYNQPPHPSFYLGSEAPLPEHPNVVVMGKTTGQPSLPQVAAKNVDYLVGDLNGDGKVNAIDMTLLKRELLEPKRSRVEKQPADLNADGDVTVADAVLMQKFLLGLDTIPAAMEGAGFYYAIDAGYSYAFTESTNAGFRDEAYLNFDNRVGSFIEWTVFVQEDGRYDCVICYANGSENARPMTVKLEGEDVQSVSFGTTQAWTEWQTKSAFALELKKGENHIRMVSETADGGPNFDWMRLAKEPSVG